jgi:hypothetical protein
MAKPILTTIDERGIVHEQADVPGFRILVGSTAQVSVSTFAELSQIKDSKMQTGALAYVGSRKGVFVLDKSSPLSVMTSSVAATKSGVGKWVRSIAPNSHWASQDLWFLDPVSGSDDNDGAASGSAIKTLEELTWRLSFLYQGLPYLINVLNDISGADKMCWNPIMLPGERDRRRWVAASARRSYSRAHRRQFARERSPELRHRRLFQHRRRSQTQTLATGT